MNKYRNHFKRCYEIISEIHYHLNNKKEVKKEDVKIHDLASEIGVQLDSLIFHEVRYKSFIEDYDLTELYQNFKRIYNPERFEDYNSIDEWLNSM